MWNSLHLQEAIKRLQEKEMCPEELITHISPICWAHIQFYGDYMFSNEQISNLFIKTSFKNAYLPAFLKLVFSTVQKCRIPAGTPIYVTLLVWHTHGPINRDTFFLVSILHS